MNFKFIFALISMVLLIGCNKPVPNPELMDPIYQDIEKERKAAETTIVSIKEELIEHEKNVQNVEPHTGQIQYARKRLYEARSILQKHEQMERFYKVRLESRKDEVFLSYMKAFRAKEPWPNPKEFEDYKSLKSMRSQPSNWRPRERLEKYKADIRKAPRMPAEGS